MNNTHALPHAPADPPDWRGDAACRGLDPELFFPEGSAGPALLEVREAKVVCARCPVRAQCLDFAMRAGVAFGIWGGATERERRTMRHAAS